jgi:N-acetylmuramoyl-L-alanine amidase
MRWTFAAASTAALALALAACSDGDSKPRPTTPEKPVILGAEPSPAATAKCNRIVIDPGHDARANPATEPIGPGSRKRKIKDGGGTSGVVTHTPESVVNLQISLRLRKLLLFDGYCVTMTRGRQTGVSMGNVERARIANRAHAALFIRIHADGNTSPSRHGTSVLYPAEHTGWTDDILPESRVAAANIQRALVGSLGSRNLGIVARSDITGFNWSDVPVVLPELGFLTNPREDRLLTSAAYQDRAARGLERGIRSFVAPHK